MDWSEYLGHQRQRKWFANAIANNKLASTFLIVGPHGVGKRTFALLFAKSLLCTETDPKELSFCDRCETCVQIQSGTHPDYLYLARESQSSLVTMEQLVGSDESRMREGFCYELRMRPYSGRRKIGVIDDADTLAEATGNALLKTLEEPPPGAVIFLIGTSEKKQISTIRSRSQIVRFSPLALGDVEQLILKHNYAESAEQARQLAEQAQGSVQLARELSDPNLIEFRSQIRTLLSQRPMEFIAFTKSVIDHLNHATAEGQARRDRLVWCMDEVIEAIRNSLWNQLGAVPQGIGDPNRLFAPFKNLPVRNLVKLIELTQETRGNIGRFIAPAALLEAWTANFIRLARS
ncbi:MAG: ATP-binding protein [Pirellula sp.]